jgi:putative membrane protein insertion efficiency factor
LPAFFSSASSNDYPGRGRDTPNRHHHFPSGRKRSKKKSCPQTLSRNFQKESGISFKKLRLGNRGSLFLRCRWVRGTPVTFPESSKLHQQEETRLLLKKPTKSPDLSPVARVMILTVRIYQHTLSPLKRFLLFGAGCCRFHPTCSQYAIEAMQAHGVIIGGWMALRRMLRCHPWGKSGYDPVPPSK